VTADCKGTDTYSIIIDFLKSPEKKKDEDDEGKEDRFPP
jgi:hypothetical protein